MNNHKTQNGVSILPEKNEKPNPSMDDVAELSGIETLHPWGFDLSKRIGEIVDMKNKEVLEVGCGRGFFACYFAKYYNAKITGIDLSPVMIESSTARAKNEGVQHSTEFRVADASSSPFPDNSFDVVVSECGPVGLAPEPQRIVNEMVRTIKPDGYIVAHAPMWLKEITEEERKDIEKRIGGQMFTLSNMSDVFTLWEKIVIILPRALRKYGLSGLLYLNESFHKVTPLFYNGTIGTYLMKARKPLKEEIGNQALDIL